MPEEWMIALAVVVGVVAGLGLSRGFRRREEAVAGANPRRDPPNPPEPPRPRSVPRLSRPRTGVRVTLTRPVGAQYQYRMLA
jgi:hypothetical protein